MMFPFLFSTSQKENSMSVPIQVLGNWTDFHNEDNEGGYTFQLGPAQLRLDF